MRFRVRVVVCLGVVASLVGGCKKDQRERGSERLPAATKTPLPGRSPAPMRPGSAPLAREGNSIVNLYDAFGAKIRGVQHDFGFSALVHYRGKTILFDSGTNADILERNAKALGVDLSRVDFAVASHSHPDHINGFDYLLKVNPRVRIYFPMDPMYGAPFKLPIAGREPGAEKALPPEQRYFGGGRKVAVLNQSGRFWKARVNYVGRNKKIAPGIHLVATRSRSMGYFMGARRKGNKGRRQMQLGLPELSLSLETSQGEVLLVGCSHSGVDTIVRATRAYRKKDLALVLGGYHLLPFTSPQVRKIALAMKGMGVKSVAPCHCTGAVGFKVFREVYGKRYRFTGLGSRIAFAD